MIATRVKKSRILNQIPDEIINDKELNEAIKLLPSNYSFEIHKTVWNIKKLPNAKRVALQFPEGLLIYSLIISDILEQFCNVETIVMGDVTYGACCIDDFTARALDCDILIHYAHSCLVPIDVTTIKVLYVFVTIGIDEEHVIATLKRNFEDNSSSIKKDIRIAMFSTIQFNPSIHNIKLKLQQEESRLTIIAPQAMPLSKGEVLGCTSAKLDENEYDMMVFLGDGRFHLESAMIQNPNIPAYRYDPYSRKFTVEGYDIDQLEQVRGDAIQEAKSNQKQKHFGIVLGTLGRQGNTITVDNLITNLQAHNYKTSVILLSEIFPGKLAQFNDIDAFVQVACPRLSIDWGYAFNKPLLTPYEAMVMMEEDEKWNKNCYPMDYYAVNGYGRGKKPDHENLK